MKSIRIQVEMPDIQNGSRVEAYDCPIALAFRRHGIRAGVNRHNIVIKSRIQMGWGHKEIIQYYYTPPLVGDWIRVYDRGEGVLPIDFEFILDNPFQVKECKSE